METELKTPDGRYVLKIDSGASDHWGGLSEPTEWVVNDTTKGGKEVLRFSERNCIDDVYFDDDGWTLIAVDGAGNVQFKRDLRELE